MTNADEHSGVVVVVIVAAIIVAWIIASIFGRPRTIVDERGERQYVKFWNRGQPVYTPKTWQQRVQEEAALRSKRNWTFLWSAPLTFGPLYLAYQAVEAHNPLLAIVTWPLALELALPVGLIFFLPTLLQQILYEVGYQGMDGAKVTDKQPKPPPGRDLVETQKAHGDARLAGEHEAHALLNSKK